MILSVTEGKLQHLDSTTREMGEMVMTERQDVETESDALLLDYAQELGYGLSTVLMGSKETLARDVAAFLRHKGWSFERYVWEFAPVDEQRARDRVHLIAEVTEFVSDIWCPSTTTIGDMIDIAGIALDALALVPIPPEERATSREAMDLPS